MTSAPLASSAPREQDFPFHALLDSTPLSLAWTARTSASHALWGTIAASLGFPAFWGPASATQGKKTLVCKGCDPEFQCNLVGTPAHNYYCKSPVSPSPIEGHRPKQVTP